MERHGNQRMKGNNRALRDEYEKYRDSKGDRNKKNEANNEIYHGKVKMVDRHEDADFCLLTYSITDRVSILTRK